MKLADLLDRAVVRKMESGRRITTRDLEDSGPVRSSEFRRVLALAQREPAQDDPVLTAAMNKWLARTWPLPACDCDTQTRIHLPACNGVSLRDAQARAIAEAVEHKGAVVALGVGEGKTLTAILTATAFEKEHGIKNPLILCPSALTKAFKRTILAARQWWVVPHGLEDRVLGYGKLSVVGSEEMLERFVPGVVIADESHEICGRNAKSARGVRFHRLFKQFPATKFVALSGTIVKKDPRDYWQALRKALGDEQAPVPRSYPEMNQWAAAVADGTLPAGCLTELGDAGDTAIEAFGKRVRRTPGVVTSLGSSVGASIYCRVLKPQLPRVLVEAIKSVSESWEIPDGHVMADATGMHRAISQLSLGFYSKLVFPPKADREAWYETRRAWAKFVRDAGRKWTLKLDSEKAVALAIDRGRLPDPDNVLEQWRKAKAAIVPQNVTVWLDRDFAPAYVDSWRKRGGGLVWSHWIPSGEHVANVLGLKWYGAGEDPEVGPRFDCAVLSVAANHRGRNLQWLDRNLLLTVTPAADTLQQLIGRTHRQGQTSERVAVDFFVPSQLAQDKLADARALAPQLAALNGEPQKLMIADWETEG